MLTKDLQDCVLLHGAFANISSCNINDSFNTEMNVFFEVASVCHIVFVVPLTCFMYSFLYTDENHQLQDERDKALQKIGNLSLGSEDMETRCFTRAVERRT